MTRRLLEALLRLAPAWFRSRYGEDLLRVHDERAARRRSVLARVLFAAREVAGMLWLVVRLRLGRGPQATGAGRGESPVLRLLRDALFALRSLRRNPGFALTAVAVLALGIGATTAIFSAANAFFLRPLPFAEPDRLVLFYETNPEYGWAPPPDDAIPAAPANVLDWREQVESFDDVAMHREGTGEVAWVRDGEPALVRYSEVTGNFFDVLGVAPALGRTFRWEETFDGADDVVVLSHDFWVSAFGADPEVVGRTIELGSSTLEVVGVMPEGFRYPHDETQIWTTYGWERAFLDQTWFRRAHWVRPLARLAPGVSMEEANAELQVVVSRLQEEYPETNRVMGAGFLPMRDFLTREIRTPVMALSGAVVLLLLLACVNVANLALVRAGDRSREVALRYALGAGRGRVVSLVVTEGLVLAGIGGALGLALGWLGVEAMGRLTDLGIDGATSVALDHRVVLFTAVAAALSGLVFSLAPALRATGRDVGEELKEGGRGGSAARGGLEAARVLVAAEVALAVLIVVGAGLMVRTAWLLRSVDPGFRTEGVLAVEFGLPSARYASRDEVLAFYDRFERALEGQAGIERAGLVGQLPLNGASWSSQFQAEGWPPDRVGFDIIHRRADRGYFEALGIPLLRGRLFEPTDGPETPLVVVINETFAREYFPGEDPIGQRIAYDRVADSTSTWREIVGIVGDQSQVSPGQPARAEVFEHRDQDWERSNWVVIRTAGDPLEMVPVARRTLREMDPLIPFTDVRTLRQVWRSSMAREELVLTLLGTFGILALLLAAVGIYGVTAQAARKRTREIGIRMALGAAAGDVVRLMLRRGMGAVVVGLALGIAGALLAARALESLLFRIEPTDPATLVSVAGLLGAVALLAVWIPARRATRVDPVESLRVD